jgi:hypothetical protein
MSGYVCSFKYHNFLTSTEELITLEIAMKKMWNVLLLSMICHSAIADGKVVLGFEAGLNRFNVDEDIVGEFERDEIDNSGFQNALSIGYIWSNNLVLEGSVNVSGNQLFSLGLTDFYEIFEAKALIGKSFEINEHFRIVPLLGISSWDAQLRESAFLNPGPEARGEFEGQDLSVKLSADFPINRKLIFSVSYANTFSDIGNIQATLVGIKFQF